VNVSVGPYYQEDGGILNIPTISFRIEAWELWGGGALNIIWGPTVSPAAWYPYNETDKGTWCGAGNDWGSDVGIITNPDANISQGVDAQVAAQTIMNVSITSLHPDTNISYATMFLNETYNGTTTPEEFAFTRMNSTSEYTGNGIQTGIQSMPPIPAGAKFAFHVVAYDPAYCTLQSPTYHYFSKASPPIVPKLTNVTISPSADTLYNGAAANFTATPACTVGPCPAGTTYSWTLTIPSLATLNSSTSDPVALKAGSLVGNVTLFVNATLNGVTVQSSAPVAILPKPHCLTDEINVYPTAAFLAPGGTQAFQAFAFIGCTEVTGYAWALTNNAMGKLNTTTGQVVVFTAGNVSGKVGLFVNGTLNGTSLQSAPVIITINATSPSPSPGKGFLGLSGNLGYVVIGVMVAVVAVAACILFLKRKKRPPTGQAESEEK
jgi:hypothetical protein